MSRVGRRDVLLAGSGMAASVLAGCSGGGGDGGPADRGPIAIRKLAFAVGRPVGYDEYEPQPAATYGRGEVIWLYADYEGLSGEPVEENSESEGTDGDGGSDGNDSRTDEPTTVEIDLRQSLTVTAPDGESIVEDEATFRQSLQAPQLERYYTGTEILLPGDAVAGEYEARLVVTDRVSDSEDATTATFEIEY